MKTNLYDIIYVYMCVCVYLCIYIHSDFYMNSIKNKCIYYRPMNMAVKLGCPKLWSFCIFFVNDRIGQQSFLLMTCQQTSVLLMTQAADFLLNDMCIHELRFQNKLFSHLVFYISFPWPYKHLEIIKEI